MEGNLGTAKGAVDTDLVRCAKAGDLDAFDALATRYEQRVYTLARRMLRNPDDAEDVTQETFLSALEHLEGFREEASFYTWLMSIASHAALKVIRKRQGLDTVSIEVAIGDGDEGDFIPHPEYIADWTENPERLLEQKETRRLLEEAMAELGEKYRLVFLLRDVEGLSVRETAEALGISVANVKVILLRARLQLRERLTRAFGDEATQVRSSHHHGLETESSV